MKILVADDEKIALNGLVNEIKKVLPNAEIYKFHGGKEVLNSCLDQTYDIAFLDIEMRDVNGIELAKELKAIHPKINIIFTTGYSEYAQTAFSIHASGYVIKPVTADKIAKEIENLRYSIVSEDEEILHIQTFGNFECFVNQIPVKFKYTKTKELLAYLVDRGGALCSNGELISILWEDCATSKSQSSYLRNLYADLIQSLKQVHCENVIIRQRGKIAICPDKVICDYYDWLKGYPYAINAYRGEYMSQYSWSVFSLGVFDKEEDEINQK